MNNYQWPDIQIPNSNLARFIAKNFVLYSNQIFLVDNKNQKNFYYKHVFSDVLRVMYILKSNHCISNTNTIGILGNDNYEKIVTLLAAIFIGTKIVLLDKNLTDEQLSLTIQRCQINKLVVGSNHVLFNYLQTKFKNDLSIHFGEMQEIKSEITFFISNVQPITFKSLRLSFDKPNPSKICLIIPKFKNNKKHLLELFYIDEFSLICQLTYAILPKCGFEWNINDIILNTNPLSTLIGILELLVTIMIGGQFVINYGKDLSSNYLEQFVHLVNSYHITACILDSSYLIELIKSNSIMNNTVKKIIYIQQPLHKNIIRTFKKKFNVLSCRFGFYLVEASGFAAIEVDNARNETNSSVVPWPSMKIRIINQRRDIVCLQGKLGKIFINSSYCSVSSRKPDKHGWIYTGYMGFYDSSFYLQIIDHYNNFIIFDKKFFSKTLIKTILLSNTSVYKVSVLKNNTSTKENIKLLVLVALKDGHQCNSTELFTLLKNHLTGISWQLCIVPRLSLNLKKKQF